MRHQGDGTTRFWRSYLAMSAVAHLAWEFLQMPLYGIWRTGSAAEIAFAGLHCTIGDLLIAIVSVVAAIVIVGPRQWPVDLASYRRVAFVAVAIGIAYTVYSEWLNVVLRKTWSYAESMPVLPLTGTGLGPLMQWVLLPALCLWGARRQGDRST